ncbi:mucin-2-like isoform X2 [Oppia nitens]|uniref:mucin-2-like isoform X2 n=1 Tax=Oppia nitens TaxID=1686743 RepID=UPI0023D9F611|nr:mucin-2-like isoform X2 [Oppia nitens]
MSMTNESSSTTSSSAATAVVSSATVANNNSNNNNSINNSTTNVLPMSGQSSIVTVNATVTPTAVVMSSAAAMPSTLTASTVTSQVQQQQQPTMVQTMVNNTAVVAAANQQQIVTSSQQQQQQQLIPTSQTNHLNTNHGLIAQSIGTAITSVASHHPTVHMAAQQSQTNTMQSLIQTSMPQAANQMSVAMSSLPQVQMIQQPLGAAGGPFQFQQVYPQQMLLPGNLTIQNLPFGTTNQGLSLQIPFTGAGALNTGGMPITTIAAKQPIMSKGVAISPLPNSHQMLSQIKPNTIGAQNAQLLKQMIPGQQFLSNSATNQTVVISQLLPQSHHHQHHSMPQSILPATKGMDIPKGKPFMLSNSGAIQPKSSPILPATSISSPLLASSQFKNFTTNHANTAQLIATQTPSGQLITNQQIFGGSFQTIQPGLTWTTGPQSTLVSSPNGPIFIRGPGQGGEHMFISTSNISSPHIQTVSMAPPMNMQSASQAIHMNTAPNQSQPTHLTTTIQPIPVSTHISSAPNITTSTATTSLVTTTLPTAIAPAPTPPTATKSRNIRQQSSIATQTNTAANAQKQHPESTSSSSTTPLKAIAPAKPKPSPQQQQQPVSQSSKTVNKESSVATTTTTRSTGVGATQTTINQSTIATAVVAATTPSTKADAGNQTTRVSVATETPPKTNSQSQMSNNRFISDNHNNNSSSSSSSTTTNTTTNTINNNNNLNKHIGVKSTTTSSTGTDMNHTKNNNSSTNAADVSHEIKLVTKRVVEKRDASTGEENEMLYSQHNNHKSVHMSMTQSVANIMANNNTLLGSNQTNGLQNSVLSDLNRLERQPPQKAIVKPQILTHVIDGYVIQESANPFPVNGLSQYNNEFGSGGGAADDRITNGIIPTIENTKLLRNSNENSLHTTPSPPSAVLANNRTKPDKHICLNCGGKRKSSSKNGRMPKRFCSHHCSDTFNDKTSLTTTPTANTQRLSLYNSVTARLNDNNNDTQKLNDDLMSTNDNNNNNTTERHTGDERKKTKVSSKKSSSIESANDLKLTKNGDINDANNHCKNLPMVVTEPHLLPNVIPPQLPPQPAPSVNIVAPEENSAIAGLYIPPGGRNPLQWSVSDVYDFVRNLQGCTEYADDFRSQEIDGQALMLIKEDHLMNTMNMKLGPALKICSKINALRDDCQKQSN